MSLRAPRREVAVWCLYDFADSAFTTLIVTVTYALYFRGVVAADKGAAASTYWGLSISLSMALVALLAPLFGAVADFAGRKKLFLGLCAGTAIVFTALLRLVGPGDIALGMALFILANVGYEGAHVFYNGFLLEIASDRELGRVSGYGWAVGYLGGLLALGLSLPLTRDGFGPAGIDRYRWTFPLVALFHLTFALPLFLWLKERAPRRPVRFAAMVREGTTRLATTLRSVRRYPDLLRFLLAFFIYNDGVMTVISFGAIYALNVIGFTVLQVTLLFFVMQLTAAVGAFVAGRLVDSLGPRKTILMTLGLWCFVVLGAFLSRSVPQFFAVCVGASIGMGSTQTASRSLMALLVPPGRSAEFFGFYGLTGKVSAIFGPLAFGAVAAFAGSERPAVLSVLPFFAIGYVLLLRVDVDRARAASGRLDAPTEVSPVAGVAS
ncbi:MAG TPA: MFS transporter [Candidatus Polarisedimenticolia bacterium]|nr:MFS transporter [Candidatus Polarisedimenticolia bacterium]